MGKLNKESDSDEAMDVEPPQPLAKHKKIKKKAQKNISPTNLSQQSKPKSESRLKTNKVVKKFAKMVNLPKARVELQEKQGIFKKIVQDIKGDKKIKRKQQKKKRVLIKKKLRKEFEENIITPPSTNIQSVEAMEQQKHIVKKEKFQQAKVVQEFKKNIGLKFGSLKQILAKKLAS